MQKYAVMEEQKGQFASQLAETESLMVKPNQYENSMIQKVKFVAHRGLSTVAPENTIPAFVAAAKAGFDGLESDIRWTSDGHIVVHHDEDVDRMTDGVGKVEQMTFSQIQSLKIDAGANVGYYPNLRIPTLAQYLSVCKQYGKIPYIEYKSPFDPGRCLNLVNVLRNHNFEEKCFVMCFDYNVLLEIRKHSKKLPLQYLSHPSQENLLMVKELGNAQMSCQDVHIREETVSRTHNMNLSISTWTVDNYNTARNLIDLKVDSITSNRISKITKE